MNVRRPLLRQFTVILAGLIVALSWGAFAITSQVIRSGLEDLFTQRLEHAKTMLVEYVRGRNYARVSEIEGVLTSPRFLAAMETLDPATIAESVPTHAPLELADLLLIVDSGERTLVATGADPPLLERIRSRTRDHTESVEVIVHAESGDVYELVVADVIANNGALLGRVVVGSSLAAVYTEDLRRLTGFEILLVSDGRVAASSGGRTVAADADVAEFANVEPETVSRVNVRGRKVLAYCVPEPVSGIAVTFVAPIDDTIDPIMTRVRGLLLTLALVGGLVGLGTLYVYTKRRVVLPVQRLAAHAESIARGNLGFRIEPETSDELGCLAAEFEKMRSQLESNRREIEAAHRERVDAERLAALGRFATGIIHDFKNPMAVVRGTADLIQARDPNNEKVSRQCGVIHRQIDRMVALTRDVLEYANGRSVLDVCEVDVAAFLGEIRDGHAEPFARAGIKLALRGEALRATIDPIRMRRVIDNVVTNALEISRVGDTVAVTWGRADSGDVFISISDEGPGVPPDLAARIFEPFVTSGKEGGSGLGLAIARKIVQDHGGDLSVGRGPQAGAVFTVTLPGKLYVESKQPMLSEVS